MIVQTLIGPSAEPARATALQVCVEGVAIFGVAMFAVRLAARRFASEPAPFGVILGMMLGAAVFRSLDGPSQLVPVMACVALLVLAHWMLERVSVRYRRLGELLLDRSVDLAREGDRDAATPKRSSALEPHLGRSRGLDGGFADLKDARLVTGRGGHVSVVPRRPA